MIRKLLRLSMVVVCAMTLFGSRPSEGAPPPQSDADVKKSKKAAPARLTDEQKQASRRVDKLITQSQKAKTARERRRAIHTLGDTAKGPKVVSALAKGLTDTDRAVRRKAADEIGDQVRHHKCELPKNVITALKQSLSDSDLGVRIQATQALRLCGYTVIFGRVREPAQKKKPDVDLGKADKALPPPVEKVPGKKVPSKKSKKTVVAPPKPKAETTPAKKPASKKEDAPPKPKAETEPAKKPASKKEDAAPKDKPKKETTPPKPKKSGS